MIDGSVGRGRCEAHGLEAHFTCPRCGAFTCPECRAPTDSTKALLRTMQVRCRTEAGVETWCEACVWRPAKGPSVTGPLVAFGALLVGLMALLVVLGHG